MLERKKTCSKVDRQNWIHYYLIEHKLINIIDFILQEHETIK